MTSPKKYTKRVKWNFHLAIEGYGKDCREAVTDALINALRESKDWHEIDCLAIENHETDSIDEDDVEEE